MAIKTRSKAKKDASNAPQSPTNNATQSAAETATKKRAAPVASTPPPKRPRFKAPAGLSRSVALEDFPQSWEDFPESNERGSAPPTGTQAPLSNETQGDSSDDDDKDHDVETLFDFYQDEKTWRDNMENSEGNAQPGYRSIPGMIYYMQNMPEDAANVVSVHKKFKTNNMLVKLQERQKTCSGRDELCNSVLNDEWASHPTWASEDSGFIAHKKNLHEEGLHRIEEERHDYDYNVEACSRTIQLLEPLAQSLRRLSEQEQLAFKLPPGLGGQSETIYKRIIMKVYGREKGQDVIQQLHLRPYQVIPVLLNRLKERLETWKLAQREWEKVWREQTQRMFWKSLDHQFVNTRTVDKRALQLKVLQAEIQMKHEEMKREDKQVPGVMHKPQLEYLVEDTDVVLDLAHLLLVHIDQAMSTDTPRLIPFIKEFVPLFFGLDVDWFNAQINDRFSATETPINETADEYASGAEDSTPSRGRKTKSNNLLRSALDRGRGRTGRKDRDDSNASASRASTPDVASVADDEMAMDTAEESEPKADAANNRWLDHPSTGNVLDGKSVDPGAAYTRQIFRMWSNTPIYGFIRLFVMLYERLLKLKLGENECRETVRKAKTIKPALELGLIDKQPQDFFDDVSSNADYYRQMLDKFVRCFAGEIDFADIEETLRRFYLQSGYPLYSLDKIVNQLSRFAANVLNSEGKDKSYDIYQAFKRDRAKEATTAPQQTDYRKSVEKMLKDGDLYRIDFVSDLKVIP
jgi:paired amphipathic helix protein Sin3a